MQLSGRFFGTIWINEIDIFLFRIIEAKIAEKPEEAAPPPDTSPPPDAVTDSESNPSLPPSEAEARLIMPHENVLGGGSMALHQYVPTKELKGMEDFVEESQYYDSYKKVATFLINIL